MREKLCPHCGQPLMKGFPFCYECCRFTYDDPTDADLRRLVELSQEGRQDLKGTPRDILSKTMAVLGVVGLGVGIYLLYNADTWWMLGILYGSLALLLSAGWVAPRHPIVLEDKDYKAIGANCIAPGELKALLGEDIRYDPEAMLPSELVRQAQVYVRDYQTYQGGQLAAFRYRGIPVEMGYVHLTDRALRSYNDIELFEGFCLMADTGRPFPKELRVIQNYLGWLHMPEEPTPESYGSLFHEKGENFLTPDRRRALVEIIREGPGEIGLWLRPDGKIFVASNGLWPICRETRPPEQWRKEYRRALSQPLRVLDLFLNT